MAIFSMINLSQRILATQEHGGIEALLNLDLREAILDNDWSTSCSLILVSGFLFKESRCNELWDLLVQADNPQQVRSFRRHDQLHAQLPSGHGISRAISSTSGTDVTNWTPLQSGGSMIQALCTRPPSQTVHYCTLWGEKWIATHSHPSRDGGEHDVALHPKTMNLPVNVMRSMRLAPKHLKNRYPTTSASCLDYGPQQHRP